MKQRQFGYRQAAFLPHIILIFAKKALEKNPPFFLIPLSSYFHPADRHLAVSVFCGYLLYAGPMLPAGLSGHHNHLLPAALFFLPVAHIRKGRQHHAF